MTRAPEMALPEVTIAVSEEEQSFVSIRRFGLMVGVTFSTLLALVAFTPLSEVYFRSLLGMTAELTSLARNGAAFALLMPLAMSFVTVSRGMLTSRHNTRPQAIAMVLELATLILVLAVGVGMLQLPGIAVATFGLSLALIIEALFLWLVLSRFPLLSKLFPSRARLSKS